MTEPKLYWRVKKNGKWTWERAIAAVMSMKDIRTGVRHQSNTTGYGFLHCFKYIQGESE